MSTIDAIDPTQKGVTIYDKILPKEINKIMKKIGGKKYDDDNYFTKKEFYASDKDPTSPNMPSEKRYKEIVICDCSQSTLTTTFIPVPRTNNLPRRQRFFQVFARFVFLLPLHSAQISHATPFTINQNCKKMTNLH